MRLMTPSTSEDLTTRSLSLTPCPVRACSQQAARSPSDSDNVLAKHSYAGQPIAEMHGAETFPPEMTRRE